MRTVRGKLLFIVGLCLVPLLLATLFFSAAMEKEERDDAAQGVLRARETVDAALEDDAGDLDAAARMFLDEPLAVAEAERGDQAALGHRLAQYRIAWPGMEVLALDGDLAVVASSEQEPARGVVRGLAEAVARSRGSGLLALKLGKQPAAEYLALLRPIPPPAAREPHAGATPARWLLALERLDDGFLDDLHKRVKLAFALEVDGKLVAQTADHPRIDDHLPAGTVDVRTFAGRAFVLTQFAPERLQQQGGARAQIFASIDITELVRDHRRFLLYRLATLFAVAALSIATAVFLGSRMTRNIESLDRVLPGLAQRRYEQAQLLQTNDELQRLGETYNAMIAQLKEGDLWRRALGKYLSRAALEMVKKGELQLGGTLVQSTILFSDIRGFTTLSEHMDPVQVLGVLNRYFTEMVSAVIKNDGIVDKFIGDAIMAVWGPPRPEAGDALNAVRAALEMRARLEALNLVFAKQGLPILKTGIGIHSGPVVAGNMGAEGSDGKDGSDVQAGKMEYTVIGDAVNLASRLESLTKELQAEVVISEDTWALVRDHVRAEPIKSVQVKGRGQPVLVYRLLGLK